MANTTQHSFSYNKLWSITVSSGSSQMSVSSSGTRTKSSDLIPISQITGNISATVYGGFGWIAAHDDEDETPPDYCNSLYVNLYAKVYLVDSNGNRLEKASAKGSASRTGELQLYGEQTRGTFTFNTANITAEEKQIYQYVQLEFICSTSSSSVTCKRKGSFENDEHANPSGQMIYHTRDTINVDFDGTEMTALYFDGTEMGGLNYDGNVIY